MIIALDIDDTITRHPEFFSLLTKSLSDGGHTVLIITYREGREETEEDLQGWGIAYDTLITATSQKLLEHGVNEWKAAVCREHDVEIFFEDDSAVLEHIDGSVFCLMPINQEMIG
jgi:hypothetical protein